MMTENSEICDLYDGHDVVRYMRAAPGIGQGTETGDLGVVTRRHLHDTVGTVVSVVTVASVVTVLSVVTVASVVTVVTVVTVAGVVGDL